MRDAKYIQTGVKNMTYQKWSTKKICMVGLFMCMNIALSSFGVPVPGGHLYLCDIIIFTAALLLDPTSAMIAGGVGAFLGDLIFYPAPMFVSLFVHGFQAFVASYCSHNVLKKHPKLATFLGLVLGIVITKVGYFLGKTFVYSTFAYAIMKIPYELAQGTIGAVGAVLLVYKFGLKKIYEKTMQD